MDGFDFDVFISHASEDKSVFVTPLANALKKFGLKVWFDKFTLKVGDSLHDSIEKGLARSRYGVVVFSPKFLSKKWTRAELNGLFTREMEGHKVILPVWHNLSAARMRAVLPMQADKYALRSSNGIEAVARSLVEAIRPELLELDVMQASVFEAGENFITEAQKKHPGYDFVVQSGPVCDATSLGAKIAMSNATRRIEIRVSNPAVLASPPGGHIQFFGEGVKKANEFQRTGKPQKWESGEFALDRWNIPLMPSVVDGSTLAVGPREFSHIPPRHLRLEIGSPPTVIFPIMEMRLTRLGTREAEAAITDKESPLTISIIFPVGTDAIPAKSGKVAFSLSWEKTTGKDVSECKKLIAAVDALRDGRILKVIDIRLERPIFESKARVTGKTDPFAREFRRTVLLVSQIAIEFSIQLRMPDVISQEDSQSLFHLDCLINDRAYGQASNTTLRFIKTDGEMGAAHESFINGEGSVLFTDEPSDYPAYFPLFGQRVQTPPWGRFIEFVPIEAGAEAKAYAEAPMGSEVGVKVTAKGPAHLRWKSKELQMIP